MNLAVFGAIDTAIACRRTPFVTYARKVKTIPVATCFLVGIQLASCYFKKNSHKSGQKSDLKTLQPNC